MIPHADHKIFIQDYSYKLPEDRIALHPLAERDQSKLLVYQNGDIQHSIFSALTEFIPKNSILFFNNTKVIPARLFFTKETGATIEIFLLHPVWPSPIVSLAMSVKEKSQWHCTIGNLKRWQENFLLKIETDHFKLQAQLIDKENLIVEFQWSPAVLTFSEVLEKIGAIPLPPYIKRKVEGNDQERYQTVYSKEDGAVAAPTAGLHFTEKIFSSLNKKEIATEYLTLHVSAGTFQPVKVEDATKHRMHSEQVIVTKQNIENILSGKTTVAVGTTSLRTLESLYWYGVKLRNDPKAEFTISQNEPYQLMPANKMEAMDSILKKMETENTDQLMGETSIYILPGYDFKMTDALITNFHQPGSTLMLLVAAFVGEDWRKIYESALINNYRFLSYGDSSLLFRNPNR